VNTYYYPDHRKMRPNMKLLKAAWYTVPLGQAFEMEDMKSFKRQIKAINKMYATNAEYQKAWKKAS